MLLGYYRSRFPSNTLFEDSNSIILIKLGINNSIQVLDVGVIFERDVRKIIDIIISTSHVYRQTISFTIPVSYFYLLIYLEK